MNDSLTTLGASFLGGQGLYGSMTCPTGQPCKWRARIRTHTAGHLDAALLREREERLPHLRLELLLCEHALHDAGAITDDGESELAMTARRLHPAAQTDALVHMLSEVTDSSDAVHGRTGAVLFEGPAQSAGS